LQLIAYSCICLQPVALFHVCRFTFHDHSFSPMIEYNTLR
jgi:hypothetical protein